MHMHACMSWLYYNNYCNYFFFLNCIYCMRIGSASYLSLFKAQFSLSNGMFYSSHIYT